MQNNAKKKSPKEMQNNAKKEKAHKKCKIMQKKKMPAAKMPAGFLCANTVTNPVPECTVSGNRGFRRDACRWGTWYRNKYLPEAVLPGGIRAHNP